MGGAGGGGWGGRVGLGLRREGGARVGEGGWVGLELGREGVAIFLFLTVGGSSRGLTISLTLSYRPICNSSDFYSTS